MADGVEVVIAADGYCLNKFKLKFVEVVVGGSVLPFCIDEIESHM